MPRKRCLFCQHWFRPRDRRQEFCTDAHRNRAWVEAHRPAKGRRGAPLLEQARELGIWIPPGASRQRIWQLIQKAKAA